MSVDLTKSRKLEHIRICAEEDVETKKSNGFDSFEFEHKAVPEMSLNDINVRTRFLGTDFKRPFFIEAMTGGAKGTGRINRNLAKAAEELGIGMGLGSQRAMLEDSDLASTYDIREIAPNIFLLGNIGAVQLPQYSFKEIRGLVKDIDATGIAVHLNVAQELSQPEGDTDFSGLMGHIKELASKADFPVIVKETGCGISGETAAALERTGISAIDVAGAGGTSFIKVEKYRGSKTAEAFSEWGMKTADSLFAVAENVKVPVIASGGMRNGLDCAKAISMGANLAGFARPLLKPAMESADAVKHKLILLEKELKKAMMLTASGSIAELSKAKIAKTA